MTLCSNQYALAIGVNDIDAQFCVCSSLVLSPGGFVILFLEAGRHFRDSKTQSTGLAPGSEGWALKSLARGGAKIKKLKKKLKPVAP